MPGCHAYWLRARRRACASWSYDHQPLVIHAVSRPSSHPRAMNAACTNCPTHQCRRSSAWRSRSDASCFLRRSTTQRAFWVSLKNTTLPSIAWMQLMKPRSDSCRYMPCAVSSLSLFSAYASALSPRDASFSSSSISRPVNRSAACTAEDPTIDLLRYLSDLLSSLDAFETAWTIPLTPSRIPSMHMRSCRSIPAPFTVRVALALEVPMEDLLERDGNGREG